jgi:hypothetical protein
MFEGSAMPRRELPTDPLIQARSHLERAHALADGEDRSDQVELAQLALDEARARLRDEDESVRWCARTRPDAAALLRCALDGRRRILAALTTWLESLRR